KRPPGAKAVAGPHHDRSGSMNVRRSMAVSAAAVVLSAVVLSTIVAFGQPPDAAQILAAARAALGGEQTLLGVKTLVAAGRTRQLRGNNLVPIEFEINCELPARFVRKDEIPAQDSGVTVSGFSGDTLIQFPPPPSGRAYGPGPTPGGRSAAPVRDAPARCDIPDSGEGRGRGGARMGRVQPRIQVVKQDCARLMRGAFAASFPTFPLTFKYAGVGEAPEGKADVLDVAGPGNFAARLVVQQDTHLPVMLMWQQPS